MLTATSVADEACISWMASLFMWAGWGEWGRPIPGIPEMHPVVSPGKPAPILDT